MTPSAPAPILPPPSADRVLLEVEGLGMASAHEIAVAMHEATHLVLDALRCLHRDGAVRHDNVDGVAHGYWSLPSDEGGYR